VKPNGDPAGPAAPARPSQRVTNYFDKALAWKHMQAQVGFGYRIPGTPAATQCKQYLAAELGRYCDSVEEQEFTVKLRSGPTKLCNVIGRIKPKAPRRVLLMAHWDTRPSADMNPPGTRNQPIEGANDGASGVAILLELARVSHEHPPDCGVDIVLVDGEDYGPSMTMMFLGAKEFAARLTQAQVDAYSYGVLLDMVGDASLDLHPEKHSESKASRVYAAAFEISQQLGYSNFRASGAYQIFDDHLPLLERGVRMYDFIDFNYPYWHTTQDTLDKCSADSLEAVGRTVENLLYRHPELYGPNEKLRPGSIPGDWK
jgi:Zn-dependent M28 family amino/carboxypeptidase